MVNYFKLSKFFLYLVPLSFTIVSNSTLFPFIVGKYAFFRTTVGLALIFYLIGLLFNKQQLSIVNSQLSNVFKRPLVIAVSIFVFIFILAGFFGVDTANSFWSNFERGEGGLQLLSLWLFFILLILLFREEKDWQKLFILAIIGGIGMALYGFLAALGAEKFIGPKFSDSGFRFSGSIGNPAYTAAFSIFMMFYAAYLIVSKYRQRLFSAGSLALFGTIIFFSAVFLLAATRGAFMGLVAAVISFLGYFIFSKKELRKWMFPAIGIILIAVSLMIYFKDTALIKSIPGSRIFDISLSANTWQHRTYMWKIAIDGWKERPILGWGPENYIYVFSRHFNVNYYNPSEGFGAWFDRAHSVYFDYLVETGILGLLSFLGIWIVFYWQHIINSKSQITNFKQIQNSIRQSANKIQNSLSSIEPALLFALPIAYLVQGIVLFDVLPIYFNLFLFLSFAAYKFSKQEL